MEFNDQQGGYPQQGMPQPDYNHPAFGHEPTPNNGNPYGQQPPYGQPPYGAPQEQKPKGFAIASMVCGIVSIVICCCEYIAIPLGIVAIVLGIISLKKGESGKGMAIAGIVCAGCSLVFIGICFILYYSGAVDTSNWEDILSQLESMAGSEA